MIWIDNRPLDELVYAALDVEGWHDDLADRAVVTQPGTTGAVLGVRTSFAPRELTIRVDIRPSALSGRMPALDALAKACAGVRVLRFLDAGDREALAECRGLSFRDYGGGAFGHPGGYIELRWRMLTVWTAREALVTAPITTTPVPVLLGTAASAWRLAIMGSATNPVVTLRDAQGRTLQAMTLTGTVGSTERLEMDSDGAVGLYAAAGTRTAAETWLSGSLMVLDPTHGRDRFGGALTLTVSSGTGVLLHVPAYTN